MEDRNSFRLRVRKYLDDIGSQVLDYNESEFWMVESPYEFIEFYAMEKHLLNTSIALPLARGLHDGTHRKSSIIKNGTSYRLPYLIHPLMVCRMLIDIQIPIPSEEEDILLAAALCHDVIEDVPLPDHGRELYTSYHLDKRVYDTVKLVSKRKDFTEEEEQEFFHQIELHPLALMIKLSDRGNNVEDLYNMSIWKVHEYVGETRKLFLPMIRFGTEHYHHLSSTLEILEEKIVSLTEVTEILVDRYSQREKDLNAQVEALRTENAQLRQIYKELWEQ